MKKIFLISVLIWCDLSFANGCGFFYMEKDKKLMYYHRVESIIRGHFAKFFNLKKIEFVKQSLRIKVVAEFDTIPPHVLRHRIIIFFMGETKNGEFISTRPSLAGFRRDFYEGATELFFLPNVVGSPEVPICTIHLIPERMNLYNLSDENHLIGELKIQGKHLGQYTIRK